ncbi:g-patch domain-containing protein [Phthorimaea operculella]|nr:g-patch domain-containing protein [Phthorimaea operculella]
MSFECKYARHFHFELKQRRKVKKKVTFQLPTREGLTTPRSARAPVGRRAGTLPHQRLRKEKSMDSPPEMDSPGGSVTSDRDLRRQNEELRMRLAGEAADHKRRLDAYRRAQQGQAALVSRLQSKTMSMLAGPRRKQKVINLRAKNNAWSNDSTKFGQRMLEKMGWSSGKGLGAKENGMVEHVVARYKNDEKGLGFDDKNDQWTKHEDDFNALLANLSNGDEKEIPLHSGISLEDKSKKSKARIHYHKFTRGKDLSKYSEKDLANIFGKKSLKNVEQKEENSNDSETTEKEKVFTEKGSMEDYFKNKMLALKSKSKNFNYSYQESSDADKDYSFKGFSGTNDEEVAEEPCQGFGFQENNVSNEQEPDTKTNVKKSKKKKNLDEELPANESQDQQNEPPVSNGIENNILQDEIDTKTKVKKTKKKKNLDEDLPANESQNQEDKSVSNETENFVSPEQESNTKTKKSKKKKTEDVETSIVESKDQDEPPKKKKKRAKEEEVQETVSMEPENVAEDDHIPKKKKKRKNKDLES